MQPTQRHRALPICSQPVTRAIAVPTITRPIQRPAFQGTAEANAKIRIFAGTELIGEGFVNSDESDGNDTNGLGIWEVTVEPLVNGVHSITAEVEDLAGNISTASGALSVIIDSNGPQRPTIDLQDSDDSGISNLDNVTIGDPAKTDGVMDFIITADVKSSILIKDGNTVINAALGLAVPADFDSLDGNGDRIATFEIHFNTVQMSFPTILAEGTHLLSVETTDTAGNTALQSEQLIVTVDFTDPADPAAPNLLASSDTGGDIADDITSIRELAFDGTVEANAQVRLLANGVVVGATTAGTDGAWEITSEPLADGAYTIALDVEDLAGNINSNQTNTLSIQVDSTAPQRPTLDLLAVDDTGLSNLDNVTKRLDDVPFTVTVDASENVTTPFDPLSVVIKDGNTEIDTFTSTGGASVRTLTLAPGTHLLSVEVTDDAGNRSVQSSELVVTIDRADPAGPGRPEPVSQQ